MQGSVREHKREIDPTWSDDLVSSASMRHSVVIHRSEGHACSCWWPSTESGALPPRFSMTMEDQCCASCNPRGTICSHREVAGEQMVASRATLTLRENPCFHILHM